MLLVDLNILSTFNAAIHSISMEVPAVAIRSSSHSAWVALSRPASTTQNVLCQTPSMQKKYVTYASSMPNYYKGVGNVSAENQPHSIVGNQFLDFVELDPGEAGVRSARIVAFGPVKSLNASACKAEAVKNSEAFLDPKPSRISLSPSLVVGSEKSPENGSLEVKLETFRSAGQVGEEMLEPSKFIDKGGEDKLEPSKLLEQVPERKKKEGKDQEEKVRDNPKLRLELKVKIASLECNAKKEKGDKGGGRIRGHTLGVDLGDRKTGLSISLGGHAPRPLTVVQQRGDKLLDTILQVAVQENVDEFVVGLPKSWDGKDTDQANKCRSFAGRLACFAAKRGWRVYLHDEYGTSQDALDYMIGIGSNRRSRKGQLDAYAAMGLLINYFESGGSRAELVVPKKLDLQEQLCQGSSKPMLPEVEMDDFGDFYDD